MPAVVKQVAQQYGTKLLGSLPLDKTIRERGDQGTPTVAAEPEGEIAQRYKSCGPGSDGAAGRPG